MYTLGRFLGFWGRSFLWAIAEDLFDNIFDRCAKELLDIFISPISKGAGTVSFGDIQPKTEFQAPFLKLLLGYPTFPLG